ncbi:MAG: nicotinate-nucleotide--dimethylbenzimidazole phosphoribosyltransferase [Mariprofundales bacterium]|nr:nicotinate-nucleotide--dimethylbenzimidazole phosphoribosyltransferase [Mariprofundales bacterium]
MSAVVWSQTAYDQARMHQQQLTKPAGSLGRLEDLACWLAGCQQRAVPHPLQPVATLFAADHGVANEGVSAFPQVVTGEMVKNFAAGGAAINVLAQQHQVRLTVVDVGVAGDLSSLGDAIVHAKVTAGSGNIACQPAMDVAELEQALAVGRAQADEAIDAGANLLIAGEMGIANTTPAAALLCALLAADPEDLVGRGTGIDDQALQHKRAVVAQALRRIDYEAMTPEEVLRQLGGLEIAAICGFLMQGARRSVPALIDGFIVTAAALVAERMEPGVSPWWQASHRSQELGHHAALAALGLTPLLDMGMRLGEGSGALLALPLLQSAVALHADMATFGSAGVSTEGG